MAEYFQFTVNDTSPSISYFPFGDTFSVTNTSSGWNPYYTESGFPTFVGQIGNGSSEHITALDGASLSVQFNGTGIQFFGNTTGQASCSFTLDGQPRSASPSSLSDNILANFQNLTNTNHTILLTVNNGNSSSPTDSFVAFNEVTITSLGPTSPPSSSFGTSALDDSDIAFMGKWSFQENYFATNISMHTSAAVGDRARAVFKGTAITVTGLLSPNSGNFSVILDNQTTVLSAQSSFSIPNTLLFFASGLDEVMHQIVIRNDDGKLLGLTAGGFEVTGDDNSQPKSISGVSGAASSVYPRGTIAAIALAAVLALVIIALLLYFFVFRPRARRKDLRNRIPWRKKRSRNESQGTAIEAGVEGEDVIDISSRVSPKGHEENDDDKGEGNAPGYRFGFGLIKGEGEKSSVDFNLDPALYVDNLENKSASSKGSKGRTEGKDKTYTFDLPLPTMFRQRASSSRSHSPASSHSRQATHLQLPRSNHTPSGSRASRSPRSSLATPGHGHSKEGSRQFLIEREGPGSERPTNPPRPESMSSHGEIELSLGPRISDNNSSTTHDPTSPPMLTDAQMQGIAAFASRPRLSLSLGPRVSFGPREPRDKKVDRKPFLNMRAISPFRVDIPTSRRVSKETRTGRVSFDIASSSARDDGRIVEEGVVAAPLTPMLQLTPTNAPENTGLQVPGHILSHSTSHGALSFLDFTSSASSSDRRRSSEASNSSRGQSQSRWSGIAGAARSVSPPGSAMRGPRVSASGMSISLGGLITEASGHTSSPHATHASTPSFPFPVALPSSSNTEGHTFATNPQTTEQPPPAYQPIDDVSSEPFPASPTDSISLDIHFRQPTPELDSRRTSDASHLPPHPPLPTPSSFRLSSQPYIVRRVLGLDAPVPAGGWSVPVSPANFAAQQERSNHTRSVSVPGLARGAQDAPSSSRGHGGVAGNMRATAG